MQARIDGGHLDISHVSFGTARAPQVELMAATGLDSDRAHLVVEAVAEANLEHVSALERTANATQGPAATTLRHAAQRQATVIRTFLERVRDPSLT
jgi:NAD(P)H-nitrite reductase large subunit